MRTAIVLALGAALGPLQARQLVPGEPLTFELDVADRYFQSDAPHRGSPFRPETEGSIYLWAESPDVRLHVRIMGPDLDRACDQLEGAELPWVLARVEPGALYHLLVASMQKDRGGEVTVHFGFARESEATKAAARELDDTLRAIEALPSESASEEAERLCREQLARLESIPAADTSRAVNDARWTLTERSRHLLRAEREVEIWNRALGFLNRFLPPTHLDVLVARENLAAETKKAGRQEEGFRMLLELLELYERHHSQNVGLARVRTNVGGSYLYRGDLERARAVLTSAILDYEPHLPGDLADQALARLSLAEVFSEMGEWDAVLGQASAALRVLERDLPRGDWHILLARALLVRALYEMGEVEGALAAGERLVAETSDEALGLRSNIQQGFAVLAGIYSARGDLGTTRALLQRTLSAAERFLHPDDHNLQSIRGNLANVLDDLGDAYGARVLMENVLESFSRTLPEEADDLQRARLNLAGILSKMGEDQASLELIERAIAVWSRPPVRNFHELEAARVNRGRLLVKLGRIEEALEIYEAVLTRALATLSEDHSDVQGVRRSIALAERQRGNLERALELEELVLAQLLERFRPEHPDVLHVRVSFAWTLMRVGEDERAQETADALADSLCSALAGSFGRMSPRELEALAAPLRRPVATVLSLHGPEDAARDLATCETIRCARLAASRAARAAAADPELAGLRQRIRDASERLAGLSYGQPGSADDWHAVRSEKEALGRELAQGLADGGLLSFPELDGQALLESLRPGESAVAFWPYGRTRVLDGPPGTETRQHLLAFVLHGGGIRRIDLGPVPPIDAAIARWRDGILAGGEPSEGRALAALIWDPLEQALEGCEDLILLPDGELHRVPFDALPDGQGRLLGDRFPVRVRASLWEGLFEDAPAPAGGGFLGLGDVDYDLGGVAVAWRDGLPATPALPAEVAPHGSAARVLRGGLPERFTALPETGLEIDAVAELFRENGGRARDGLLLKGRAASKESLALAAPDARWLHLATHGFSLDSPAAPVPEGDEGRAVDARSGLGTFVPLAGYVRGMSPMLLSGLALAGANVDSDALGRATGVLTAEELAELDLSRCELAVLSACNTNVGLRRAGQGVASLQQALHTAGARSVIASLWEVDSGATLLLMEEFYRRHWIEGQSKADALWEAKRFLQEERYAARDWAGWVLSGESD